jgi:hypothetical protein
MKAGIGKDMIASTQWQRLFAYALIVVASIVTALFLGKDFNWDLLSYHLYAGYSAVEHRLAADYFAASSQGYLNPYSQVPFYLMVKQGLSPQWVVGSLATFHALNLLIVFEIARLLNQRPDGKTAWVPVWLAVLLAFCNPIFVLELGNTFNEITTGVPVLAGWYLLVREFRAPRRNWLLLAGVLIGIGVALKLTNLLFSITALPLLLLSPTSWRARAQALLWFGLGGMLGALLAGGWWAWQLWTMFGNPLFPMFNNIFHSPEFTDGALKHYRFVSPTFFDQLRKPFLMMLPLRDIHFELPVPDFRYAAGVLLACLLGLKYLLRRRRLDTWLARDPFPAFQGQRALAALGASVLAAWILWSGASGNSRYFLPMSCLAAVVLATMLFRFTASRRFLVYFAASLLLLQVVTNWSSGQQRWLPTGWGDAWFELAIPPKLQQEPTLYLQLSTQTASFMLPYLPQGSSMISVTGMYVLEENARIRALLEKYRGHVRVMQVIISKTYEAKNFNYALARFGLEVDLGDCLDTRLKHRARGPMPDFDKHYISCATKPLQWTAAQWQDYREKKRRTDAIFDRLEAACPHIFQPRGLASEGDGTIFWRNYGNTDTVLNLYDTGMVAYRNVFDHGQDSKVGMLGELEKSFPAKAQICP